MSILALIFALHVTGPRIARSSPSPSKGQQAGQVHSSKKKKIILDDRAFYNARNDSPAQH